jgi:hypothetical protein
MLAAYRNKQPDCVPVSPEIWDATAIELSGRPWYELVGPFAKVPWWQTHLQAFEYFGCDAWILSGTGPDRKGMSVSTSRFLDDETIETETEYRTSLGKLHATARTTRDYAGWLMEHPVKEFAADMPAYAEWFFRDPQTSNLSGIRRVLEGVGEKGLVTPCVGGLFTSFLGSAREGGMVAAIYDLVDHEKYCEQLRERFVEYVVRLSAHILQNTNTQALFLNSDYSGPPIISPALYRKWDKPVLKAVADLCKKYAVPLHLHQHGHLLAVMDDIVEAGVSIVCPLFPPPQGDVDDLAALKRRYGDRIALKGNVDPFAILLKGTPRDVEREVQGCITAAAKGGGFILGTADSTVAGTPFENIRAFVEAGRKYGKYPTG